MGYNSELTKKRGRKSHISCCWLCWHRRYFTRPHYTWFLIKSVIIDNGWNVRLSRLLYWFISSLVWVSAQKKRIKVWQGGEVWQWITQYGKIKGQYKSMLKKNLARMLLIPLEYLTVSSILFVVLCLIYLPNHHFLAAYCLVRNMDWVSLQWKEIFKQLTNCCQGIDLVSVKLIDCH